MVFKTKNKHLFDTSREPGHVHLNIYKYILSQYNTRSLYTYTHTYVHIYIYSSPKYAGYTENFTVLYQITINFQTKNWDKELAKTGFNSHLSNSSCWKDRRESVLRVWSLHHRPWSRFLNKLELVTQGRSPAHPRPGRHMTGTRC